MAKKQPITKTLIDMVESLKSKNVLDSIIRERIRVKTGWRKTKSQNAFKEIIETLKGEGTNQDSPKILLVDIETAPSLGYVWGKWEQNVIQFKEDWYMLSFAYMWLGDKKAQVKALPDYDSYKKGSSDDKNLVKDLWKLFDEADIILTHNGDNFDIKKSNARFLIHGLKPPSPYKTIDTLKIARRYFKFDSNRLDDLAQYLGIGRKKAHSGKHTWFGCMAGDMKSWAVMKDYNAHDVVLLLETYLALRAWTNTHPNLDMFNKNGSCPVCQSKKVQRRGWNVTKTGKRSRLQCQSCAAWFSGLELIKGK